MVTPLSVAHIKGMVMCFISFSNAKDVRRTYEDVMAKKLKLSHISPCSSLILILIGNCFIPSHRATHQLHFLFWLKRCALYLERIMIHFLQISSLCKHFFKDMHLSQCMIKNLSYSLKLKVLAHTTFHITGSKMSGSPFWIWIQIRGYIFVSLYLKIYWC